VGDRNQFTDEALEEVITRRIANTGETRAEARAAILKITDDLNAGRIELEVFDDGSGLVIGRRDKDGYHPNANDPKRRGTS